MLAKNAACQRIGKNLSLFLANVEYLTIKAECTPREKAIGFNMMNTKIGCLSLDILKREKYYGSFRLKLYTELDGECYYKYDGEMEDFVFKVSDKQEYLDERFEQRIEIGCESIEALKLYFSYNFEKPILLDFQK